MAMLRIGGAESDMKQAPGSKPGVEREKRKEGTKILRRQRSQGQGGFLVRATSIDNIGRFGREWRKSMRCRKTP